MVPDEILDLLFARDQREVAKFSKWVNDAVQKPARSVVCYGTTEFFIRNTNPVLMLSFGVGNFQPELKCCL